MRFIKKITRYFIAVFIIAILLVLFVPSRTPGIEGQESVAVLQQIKLGGVHQYILVRGKDVSNPIMLFLHGGPGYPQISYVRKYQKQLEESFIVVNWDQRGAGKSYSTAISESSMNREQFVEDTKELINYLCKKYQKEKVYLVGHSWGSELGLYVANQYPEKIAAFISVGQVVNSAENDVISYEYVLEKAQNNKDKKAVEQLRKLGMPPYKDPISSTIKQRGWLAKYGGVERKVHTLNDIIWSSIFSPEYTGIDGIKLALGSKFTADTMWGHPVDFIRDMPETKVPIYFCAGRYDYNTSFELIEKYYNHITAPEKELIWFEESAHFPHFEEPGKFAELTMQIKLKLEK